MIVQDLINSALMLIGAVDPLETPNATESSNALNILNIMLDGWSADGLTAPSGILENFPLVAGTSAYIIGVGQTFNTPKPIDITSGFIRDLTGYDYPLDIITEEEYYSISDIGISTSMGIPEKLFYNKGNVQQSTQIGTINLWVKPNQAYTLFIDSYKYITEFVNLSDVVTFPPAYKEALTYNLARRLAPGYGTNLSADAEEIRKDTIRLLRKFNSKQIILKPELQNYRKGNIYTM